MLKGKEKAAAMLSLLGEELSQKVLGFLPEDKAMDIINASGNLATPTRDTLMDMVSEFTEYMRAPQKTQNEETPAEAPAEAPQKPAMTGTPLENITNSPPDKIANVLEGQRPEIAAYVLSHLPVEKIYDVLGFLKESRQAVESRLVSIKDVPFAKEIEESILKAIAERLA